MQWNQLKCVAIDGDKNMCGPGIETLGQILRFVKKLNVQNFW